MPRREPADRVDPHALAEMLDEACEDLYRQRCKEIGVDYEPHALDVDPVWRRLDEARAFTSNYLRARFR